MVRIPLHFWTCQLLRFKTLSCTTSEPILPEPRKMSSLNAFMDFGAVRCLTDSDVECMCMMDILLKAVVCPLRHLPLWKWVGLAVQH